MNYPEAVMRAHQYAYYVQGEPILSDYDYDQQRLLATTTIVS